ncbi:unnamed protein product [Caenorhabditis sp. 36 PRJEB53466]|nr:unnamed protein product [Caenorhabditis sp. 36 PRJEB53466]
MSIEYSQLLPGGAEKSSALLHRASRHNRFLYLIICVLLIVVTYSYYPTEEIGFECPTITNQFMHSGVPVQSIQSSAPNPSSELVYRGVVDSMDGVGYKFSENTPPPSLDPRFDELNELPECDLDKDRDSIVNDVKQIMSKFEECITPIIKEFHEDPVSMSLNWVERTEICDKVPLFEALNIQAFPNLHETKWVILPKCKQHNTMVTLGVGHDTKAEELLNRTLPLTGFYGADPIIEPNIQLYSPFGKFFPFAVGRKSGMSTFKVLPNQNQKTRKYVMQDVTTIEINYFLKSVLNLNRIDIMWIDIEGGEFEFLDYLHRGSKFDENGITICQLNVEMHPVLREGGYQQFMLFIETVLEQKRWMFLRPRNTGKGVHRMFFINMEDQKCLRKFVQ